jgi:hypothetical protein
MSFDADQSFLWYPQGAISVNQSVGAGATAVMGADVTTWDYYRIDWVSLVLNYHFSDGNTSFEACIRDTSGNYFPFLSVAATDLSDFTPEFYINKVNSQTTNPFFLSGNNSIFLRGESGLGSASDGTITVSYSTAREPSG